MKYLAILPLFFSSLSMAGVPVETSASAWGPKGGPVACQTAESRAYRNLEETCLDMAGQLDNRQTSLSDCFCTSTNDDRFERCSVLASGECFVPRD